MRGLGLTDVGRPSCTPSSAALDASLRYINCGIRTPMFRLGMVPDRRTSPWGPFLGPALACARRHRNYSVGLPLVGFPGLRCLGREYCHAATTRVQSSPIP